MKYLLKILLLLFTQMVIGQNYISGKVIYKQRYLKTVGNKVKKQSFRDFEFRIHRDISKLSFILEFNRNQYSFKSIKKMELDNKELKLALSLGGGKGIYFGDVKKNLRLHKKESFGSNFIIKSSFKELQWKIQNETKTIGKYTCRKATLLEDIYTSKGKRKRLITAWFTTEVPLIFGPVGYGNLPGLIIELHIGSKYVFYSEKIVFSKSELKILPPKRGKLLSDYEFNIIAKKAYEARKKS